MAEIHVLLRAGISDPEGQTIGSALRALGFDGVGQVRSGKLLRVEFESPDPEAAEGQVADMCRRLLANPVMETATWEIRADEPVDQAPALP